MIWHFSPRIRCVNQTGEDKNEASAPIPQKAQPATAGLARKTAETVNKGAGGFGPALTPPIKVSSPPLQPGGFSFGSLSGPAICWLSLSGRWFRGATDSVGRENLAAHRRSHRL
jgi:hypothetical protein